MMTPVSLSPINNTLNQRIGSYRLIDFGRGRKLERVAGRWLDRPSPAAEGVRPADPDAWGNAESVFDLGRRKWKHHRPWPDDLLADCGRFEMPVAPTPFGHIGLFPEQQDNWQWLMSPDPLRCNELSETEGREHTDAPEVAGDRPAALNLFAYTGASTMALATAGFAVAHVDAAKPNVATARRAAAVNGLTDWPIRYLVDDAAKFAAREVRRGRHYHTIVLDPPAYGHAPGGKAWRIERDLWPLLDHCLQLAQPAGHRLLITGHSPQVDQHAVKDFLIRHGYDSGMIRTGRSQLTDQQGRRLDAGFFVRVDTRGGSEASAESGQSN
ncbi:class I SAM-dependent methyltransferase [Crateriforma spongiae]|uniref:class I SAM-dependent methyltransferase n=1 Tax=Crateriforma spongiae TaxID=2724528 RepID=UPI0014478D8B|nr:class I SAM-dependent methyltransferase [Crateriforma spongiae]